MSEKKIAVVTGGARGIGKAIALELAKAGNLVVINYNGSEEKARETKAEIRKDHQYLIRIRRSWKCRTGQLCGIQSRDHRSYKIRCKGAGIQRDHGQRHCTGIYQNRYDGRAF